MPYVLENIDKKCERTIPIHMNWCWYVRLGHGVKSLLFSLPDEIILKFISYVLLLVSLELDW